MNTEGRGNDGPWTPWKTESRFSTAPTALGNRQRRDFHIPTAPTKRWKSGKPKAGFPLSHRTTIPLLNRNQKGGLVADRFAPAPGSFFN
jgi:hypothetical protein